MLNIYIDGDSCPVKDEILRVATRHSLEVYLVSNRWTSAVLGPRVHKILVSAGADEADNWIADHISLDDIAITADILLAQRCIKNSAQVISPYGKSFTDDNIGIKVAMRNLNTHLRETGELFSYNQAMGKPDRSRFLQTFETIIQKIKASNHNL